MATACVTEAHLNRVGGSVSRGLPAPAAFHIRNHRYECIALLQILLDYIRCARTS